MALIPGSRLGPYEITAQIGVGGMGEVYRATDTTLKREVAVKVLPARVASDAERLTDREFLDSYSRVVGPNPNTNRGGEGRQGGRCFVPDSERGEC